MSQRSSESEPQETSARTSAAGPANAIGEERILDAAYELLLAIGMRRMTMADIARHAEVSRATLYRRWPNVQAVVAALMTREWTTALVSAFQPDAADGRSRLVEGVVEVVAKTRVHPLMRKIIELDPEFLTPYLLERRGSSTVAHLALVEEGIKAGPDRRLDPDRRPGLAGPADHPRLAGVGGLRSGDGLAGRVSRSSTTSCATCSPGT